jgi:hypothetical protein
VAARRLAEPGAPVGRSPGRDPKLRAELQRELPDLREEDIVGSPFAVQATTSTATSAAT